MKWQPLNDFYREALEREKKGKVAGYFAVIPAFILEDPELSASEKIIYGEISALANRFGFCFAGNRHFENALKIGRATLKRGLKKLEEKEYIKIEISKDEKGTHRKLWIKCGKL